MGYIEYYRAYKANWESIKAIDDNLALWLEIEHPDHDHFDWRPKSEKTVEVTLLWFNPHRVEIIEVPLAWIPIPPEPEWHGKL